MWFNSHKFYNLANTTMLLLVYPPALEWKDEFLLLVAIPGYMNAIINQNAIIFENIHNQKYDFTLHIYLRQNTKFLPVSSVHSYHLILPL